MSQNNQWSDYETAKALRAARLYENQWVLIAALEFDDRNSTQLRLRVQRELEEPPADRIQPADYDVSLLIEEEPERVVEHIQNRPGRTYIPEYLLSYAEDMEEPTDEPPLTENADIRTNEDDLNHFYIPAGTYFEGEEVEEGQYVWKINGKFYHIARSAWDDICADYSEMGGDLTQKEIARKYGIRYSVLKRMLRRAGQFKASLPFSERAVLEADSEDEIQTLENKAIEVRERYLENRIQRRLQHRQKKRLLELEKEHRTRQRFLTRLADIASDIEVPDPPTLEVNNDNSGNSWRAHLPTTDEHIGLEVWGRETFGGNYDTDIGCMRLRSIAHARARWVAEQPGRCEVVYRTFIGDLIHALTGETEHGTQLDQDTRSARVWKMLIETLIYCINVLRPVCDKVVVIGSRGNHDGEISFFQAMYALKMVFEASDADDVEVRATPHRFSHYRVGDTLHILDHGYYMNKLSGWKAKSQAETTARATAGPDFHGAQFIVSYYGHRHEREVTMAGAHHELRRLPPVCEVDDHATDLRYHSHAVADAFRLDDRGRLGAAHRRFWLDELDLE